MDSQKVRPYENLHIVLWLLKDTCWVATWRLAGVLMVVPTLLVAIYITWLSRKDVTERFHNLAVVCWICANSIWMIGEFYLEDGTRPLAGVFFAAGLACIAWYYAVLRPRSSARIST